MIETTCSKKGLKEFNANVRKELLDPRYMGFVKHAAFLSYSGMKKVLQKSIAEKLSASFPIEKAESLSKNIVKTLEAEGVFTNMIIEQSSAHSILPWNWLNRGLFRRQLQNLVAVSSEAVTVDFVVDNLFELSNTLYSSMAGALELDVPLLDEDAFVDCHRWLKELVTEKVIQP